MNEKTTSFQQLVDQIVEHMKPHGFYHDYQKTQNSTSYAYIAHNDNNLSFIGLYFDSYRKKINVKLDCEHHKLFKDYSFTHYLPEHLKNYSISMSSDKDPKKCAQDILKRVAVHFNEFNDVVIDVKRRQDEFNSRRGNIQEDIARLKKNVGNLWKYDSDNKRDVEIDKDYGSVKIETSRLSVQTLTKIVQLIDAELYRTEGHKGVKHHD